MSLINNLFILDDHCLNDKKRKSHLLNFINFILIIFLFLIVLIKFFSSVFLDSFDSMDDLILLLIMLTSFSFMFFLVKKGFVKFVSIAIILFLAIFLFVENFKWGIDLYIIDIFYPLLILLSGLLLGSTFSFFIVFIISFYLLGIYFLGYEFTYLQFKNWKDSDPSFSSLLIILIIYLLMSFASWISSREIENSFNKIKVISNKLKLQMEKLIKLSPVIDLGKLTAGLVHDIRQPLSVLNILIEDAKLNKNQIDNIDEAILAIDKINEITQSCSFGLFSNSEYEVFNLNQEMKKIINLFEYKARTAKVRIYFKVSNSYEFYSDRIKLNQVIANIIMNAIESYEGLNKKEKDIFIKFIRNKRNLLIKIKDYGHGIKAENLKKIFDPGFSLKDQSSSLGMGLYTSNEMMNKFYETKLKVESKYGVGSTFIINIKNKFILDPNKK